jgi:hypothetical protein
MESKDSGRQLVAVADKARQKAYLKMKGIIPDKPFQLDLLFPNTVHDNERFIPNDYARSSIFTARNKRTPRLNLVREQLFHLHEGVSILYTGIELRAEDDEIIWLQTLHYAKKHPLGEPFEFSIKDLVRDVGWARNGRYYEKARECISRLKASEVLVHNDRKYGKSGAISLIAQYVTLNDNDGKATRYQVWINPNLILLFAGNDFTNHSWKTYRDLTPIARRLADYISSHKVPYPLKVEQFRRMCGSNELSLPNWRRNVKRACAEIQEKGIAKLIALDKGDNIHIIRK